MPNYELVLNGDAALVLAHATRPEQRHLAGVLDGLKRSPFQEGDLRERDAQGRINEVLVAGDWLVTFWSDHAVREVRVVKLERVGD